MKKYISILCVALSLCAAAAGQPGDPTEGYFVTPDNVKIFYKIEGRGSETLVAVHGGPGNSLESIRADFEPLAKGRRVIYYDQRGQGRSELLSDGKKLGYEQHVADLCAGGIESVRQQPITRNHLWRSLGDYNLMSQLGVVKAPVLVIHGAADVIPLKSSEFWAFGYPNARLLVIEKAGHISQIEAPEIFFPAIDTFLKGSFPAAAKTIKHP